MVKNMLIVFVVMIFSSLAQAAGALAIDENQGDQYGFAYDYASVSEASERALSECGGNCSVVQVFESGCAAYAADQTAGSTIYGWATSSDGGDAQSQALQYCSSYGGSQCMVRSWGCNSQ
jgi:hypothetical protein